MGLRTDIRVRVGAVGAVAAVAAGLVSGISGAGSAVSAAAMPVQSNNAPAQSDGAPAGWSASGYSWTRTLARPGLAVYAGTLSDTAAHPTWTVTVFAPVVSSLTGQHTTTELGTSDWATQTADQLRTAGYQPRVDALNWPDYTDTPHGVQGYRVRTGSYPTQAAAQAAEISLQQAGFATATAQWTGYDPDHRADAEQVHVAVVDPGSFRGSIAATHGSAIAQRTRTTDLAQQAGAIVAVNGGFFVTSAGDGYPGAPSGLAAYAGTLQSMAVGDRTALLLSPDGHPSIRHLVADVALHAAGGSHEVDGLNRLPGVVRDCGRPGLTPTSEPRQDVTCTAADDIVLFTPALGAALPSGPGSQVTVDRTGHVSAAGARGGSVPAGGFAVQAVGASADWLTKNAAVGSRLAVQQGLRDGQTGQPVRLAGSIVSAAPLLVRDGRSSIDAATEGVIDPKDPSFNYAWGEIRQPRTIAGIDRQGRLLLVTVDGREPGVSEGLSLTEESTLLRELGAVDGLNLDGGGSTAMAVNGALVNHPSDSTGERADGDAVVVVPRSTR